MITTTEISKEESVIRIANLGTLREKYDKAYAEFESLSKTVEEKKKQAQTISDIHNAYLGLRRTKTDRDPGKYGPAYSLRGGESECPGCKVELPVIERYHQTMDSPGGDEWEKTHNIYCPTCLIITEVRKPEYSDMRF